MVKEHPRLQIKHHFMFQFQVVLALWLSALTATTTPTSTLAHGNTAAMLTWMTMTLWTRLYQA